MSQQLATTRSSGRIRKKRTLYAAGGRNEGGANNQSNEMGVEASKDAGHHQLVQYFKETLEPMGWRMDHPPPYVCADYTFVPASLKGVNRKHLYKLGRKGTHYAAEWEGLRAMLEAHAGALTYAPTLPPAAGNDAEIRADDHEDADDDDTVAYGNPVDHDDAEEASAVMDEDSTSGVGVANTIATASIGTTTLPTRITNHRAAAAPRVSLSPQQQATNENEHSKRNLPVLQPTPRVAPTTTAAPIVVQARAPPQQAAETPCLESLYLHKRLLEEDLARLEDILDDNDCPPRKRARTERELADQEAHFFLVKKAIVNGHVSVLTGN